MKTILKTFLIVAVLLLQGVNGKAQDSPIQLGVKAGANMSTMTGDFDDTKMYFGFQAGVTLDYSISSTFFLQSGLLFTMKGLKYESSIAFMHEDFAFAYAEEGRIRALYLQLPLMAAYRLNVSKSVRVAFKAGPYLAYGVGGKAKAKYHLAYRDGLSSTSEFEFELGEIPTIHSEGGEGEANTFSRSILKPFDLGLGVGIDVEIRKMVVGIGVEAGILNCNRGDEKVRNQNTFLTVGYKF